MGIVSLQRGGFRHPENQQSPELARRLACNAPRLGWPGSNGKCTLFSLGDSHLGVGLAFAFASRGRSGPRRLARSRAAIRWLPCPPRSFLTSLLAALFLVSTFAAALPVHTWPATAIGEFAQVQAALGTASEELLSSFCLHRDGNTPGLPDHDRTQPCKTCPFCCGFHHPPLLPQRSLDCPAHGQPAAAVLFPDSQELTAARETPGRRRSRAPPQA